MVNVFLRTASPAGIAYYGQNPKPKTLGEGPQQKSITVVASGQMLPRKSISVKASSPKPVQALQGVGHTPQVCTAQFSWRNSTEITFQGHLAPKTYIRPKISTEITFHGGLGSKTSMKNGFWNGLAPDTSKENSFR